MRDVRLLTASARVERVERSPELELVRARYSS
jgi:hypothetical protein